MSEMAAQVFAAPKGTAPRVGRRLRRLIGLLVLLALLVALMGASLAWGARPLSWAQIGQVLWHPDESFESVIIWQYRMPRTALAVVVGCALGVAGGLMQAITRNPLADPGLLGVHAGAALAVVLAMSLLGIVRYESYVGFALVGAALAALSVQALAGQAPPSVRRVRLLLAGTAVSACLASATAMVTLFDLQTFDAYRFWIVGSLEGRGLDVLEPMLPLVAAGLVLALAQARALDALSLGDDLGQALGQRPARVRAAGFVAIVLLCGSATAAAGPIAFVGLLVPHVVRLVVGPHWRWILPYGLMAGPVVLLAADILGRLIAAPEEIEAGIVCALIGAPILLALVAFHGGRDGGRDGGDPGGHR